MHLTHYHSITTVLFVSYLHFFVYHIQRILGITMIVSKTYSIAMFAMVFYGNTIVRIAQLYLLFYLYFSTLLNVFLFVCFFQTDPVHSITLLYQAAEGFWDIWVIWSPQSCAYCTVSLYFKNGVSDITRVHIKEYKCHDCLFPLFLII